MRSTSLASLLIGFGIGFGVMYPLMKSRAPAILSAMPVPFVPGAGGGPTTGPPPFNAKRFEQLQDTIRSEPTNYDALLELGDMVSDQRQFPEAAAWYFKAADARNTAEVRNRLGVTLFKANRPDESIEQFQKALEIDPTDPLALYDLGIVLLDAKNDADGALALWEKLVETNPNLPDLDVVKRDIQAIKEKRK